MKRDEHQRHVKRTQKDYSYQFKLQVVEEIEAGQLSIRGSLRKYGIQSHRTVQVWLDKYGTLDRKYKHERMREQSPEQEIMALRQEVALLKKQKKVLEQQADLSNRKAAFFDLMVDIAEEELSIDIRKKYATDALKRTKGKADGV